ELQATQEESVRRESEMRLATDAINNTLGTLDIDMNGTVISVNDMMLRLSRVDSSEFIGKQFIDLYAYTEEDRDRFDEAWSKVIMGENCVYEVSSNFQGIEMSFSHSLTPYINQMGDVERVFDLVVNITGQKEIAAKIATLAASYKKG
ncbi:MAG: PAS domain-containing protein, partial [Bacteroidales bacterium]|nr:PAS domain-containing protein [Bacteroidales bacterium]